MQWIHNYQLFLFDFDGLLVNTEELHYQAYCQMCADRGTPLPWDFCRYSAAAHHTAEGLREQIYDTLPSLFSQEPNWLVLYAEKRRNYLNLLNSGAVKLMPGAQALLENLEQSNILHCVVTHSPLESIAIIRDQHPSLKSIPHWITRENYSQPKPDPECYITAINRYAKPGDRIIGFEDVPRGLKALQQTQAKAVLICPSSAPYLTDIDGTAHYSSFESITEDNHP